MKTRYIHGRFYTLQATGHMVEELWVEHGTIIHLGSHPQWLADETIDVQGWTGFPGWVDAHLHILGYGEKLTLLQLNKSHDKAWIIDQIRQRLNSPFLYAQGHYEQAFTKHDLDQLSSTIPILLRHADYHGATVNSALLHQIGLSQHLTGILHEAEAMRAVQSIPKYTQAKLTTMIQAAMKQLHAYGVTGGHSDDLYYFNGYHDTLAAFESALKTVPFRTHLLIHHREMQAFLASGRPWGNQHPYLQLGAIKTFYDGTLSSQTALMQHPYQGSTHQGERQFNAESWRDLLQSIRQAGIPIAIHTIGDLALDEVADWLTQYPVKSGLHDRIIHASFAKKSTIEKLKRLSVIFDIQPQFLASDLPWGLNLISPKTELIYPWKTYLDAGLVLCGSSDAPVEIPDPLKGIEALTVRRSDHDQKIYHPDQRLTMEEAVKLYTIGANAPTYDLAHRGQLKEGFLADFTFVNVDFLKEPTRLSEAKVMMTVVDNHIVYRRN